MIGKVIAVVLLVPFALLAAATIVVTVATVTGKARPRDR